jgi:hypothetical protein
MTWEDKKLERPHKCYDRTDKDKFLTEAMGICFWGDHSCIKCTDESGNPLGGVSRLPIAINFATPESFFKLYNWAKEQDWWRDFLDYSRIMCKVSILESIINPTRFSTAIYRFLMKEVIVEI